MTNFVFDKLRFRQIFVLMNSPFCQIAPYPKFFKTNIDNKYRKIEQNSKKFQKIPKNFILQQFFKILSKKFSKTFFEN